MEAVLVWMERGGIPYLTDPDLSGSGPLVAFTSRLGGVSSAPYDSLNLSRLVGDDDPAVTENRRAAAEATGFAAGSLTFGRQVHGAEVVEVLQASDDPVSECDALVTDREAVTVAVMTADCVPVLMQGSSHVAAVHAGWRGLVGGVIGRAHRSVGDVERAWVGPCIRACCYEVGPEVTEAFLKAGLPVAADDRVDPGAAAVATLEALGVREVVTTDLCTSCDERFYSHRRDGTTGRQGAFISWPAQA